MGNIVKVSRGRRSGGRRRVGIGSPVAGQSWFYQRTAVRTAVRTTLRFTQPLEVRLRIIIILGLRNI